MEGLCCNILLLAYSSAFVIIRAKLNKQEYEIQSE